VSKRKKHTRDVFSYISRQRFMALDEMMMRVKRGGGKKKTSLLNGFLPVSITYKITPTLHMSASGPYLPSPNTVPHRPSTSGAKYLFYLIN
jgi:hypothetical protein